MYIQHVVHLKQVHNVSPPNPIAETPSATIDKGYAHMLKSPANWTDINCDFAAIFQRELQLAKLLARTHRGHVFGELDLHSTIGENNLLP